MRTYGIGMADILDAIRENRSAISYWNARKANNNFRVSIPAEKRAEIVKSHTDNIRDLRITLAAIRFDNDEMMRYVGSDFVPFVVTDAIPDTDNNDTPESDNDTVSEDSESVTA